MVLRWCGLGWSVGVKREERDVLASHLGEVLTILGDLYQEPLCVVF